MFVNEIKKLSKLGLKVEVFDHSKMKKIGMNALLGVAQGSKNLPYFVTIKWKPTNSKNKKPLSFIGKGVCFDTGGISLKPAKFMEDMKYDMAGAGAVVGLMKTFIKIVFSLFLLQSALFAAGKPYSQVEFDKLIKEGKPIVLHVHAKWCYTCAAQDPVLNSLMKSPEFKNFTFFNVDFDTSKDLLKTLKVSRQILYPNLLLTMTFGRFVFINNLYIYIYM